MKITIATVSSLFQSMALLLQEIESLQNQQHQTPEVNPLQIQPVKDVTKS